MITDSKKWHYHSVKSFPELARGITGINNGDFCCLNCFCSYNTKKRPEKHKRSVRKSRLLLRRHAGGRQQSIKI